MTISPIRVALIDDHRLVLDSLAHQIRAAGMEVVCTATTAEDGLKQMVDGRPDVILLDVELPGRGSFDLASEIRSLFKSAKLLFLTGFSSDVLIDQALRLRASGYLMKFEPINVLLESIRAVAQGEIRFSREIEDRVTFDTVNKRYVLHTAHPLSDLTFRQLEVLRHLAKGESVKEVARLMQLSQKSIDSHKYRIMHKLGIHDRVELARFAFREGLLLP